MDEVEDGCYDVDVLVKSCLIPQAIRVVSMSKKRGLPLDRSCMRQVRT